MIKLKVKGNFHQMYRELVNNSPELREVVAEKVKWFRNNPDDTRLDNHALTGRMEGKWAFRIDGDIRIVYESVGKQTVRFLAIGGHKNVYKK